MQDLRLVGVHDDGTHLLLEGSDGERYRTPLDDALRAAVRQDRSRLGQLQIELDGGPRPRDVQAMVRAGATAQDVASRSGWPVEKVRRYEGPILAERAHVAELARKVRLRSSRGSGSGQSLATRVADRMRVRDVDPATSDWDSWRDPEAAHWTVVLRFTAGARERRALWSFDLATQTVSALDDEARWLSEDEPAPVDGPLPVPARVATTVYDVEAEGGVTATRARGEGTVDLMTAMRERTAGRGRRKRGRTPTDVPVEETPADALPLAGLGYDPDVHGLPPAARSLPEEPVRSRPARPEPAATAPVAPVAPVAPDASPQPAPGTTPETEPGAEPVAAEASVTETTSEATTETVAEPVSAPTPPDVAEPETVEPATAAEPEPVADDPSEPEPVAAVADDASEPEVEQSPVAEPAAEAPQPSEPEQSEPEQPERVEPEQSKPEPERPRPEKPARKGRPSVPSWDDIMFGGRR